MIEISIVDGYIDEPTCLGVPPYISTYPRYIAGAIIDFDSNISVNYYTIDQIRQSFETLQKLNKSSIVILIAGSTVPGKYLASYPASPQEILTIVQSLKRPITFLCGPAARFGFSVGGGKKTYDLDTIQSYFNGIITGDPEIVISDFLKHDMDIDKLRTDLKRNNGHAISSFATKGAVIVKQHPYYPTYLTAEIETYRGCSRGKTGGCSFCTEPFKGTPDFRFISDIHEEIKALYSSGIRHFRIGSQPCLFSFMAKNIHSLEFPQPNPDAIEELFSKISIIAPDLQTLHIDNVNPGIIAHYPEESKEIIQTIIKYHTSGDVAALGVESVDPEVIRQNNLKANKEDVIQAIQIFNEYGKKQGSNGMPELLPGLNFVCGLKGETKKTYKLNLSFLHQIMNDNLLIRRINIRQVIAFPGTLMESIGTHIIRKHQREFKHFKYKVKMEIEKPILQKLIPEGTTLTNVYSEIYKGKITFGRQLGSYPILVGIPGLYPLHANYNIIIVDHGYRSVTGIPNPLNINTCPRQTLEAIPGIGKKRAIRILRNRPFHSLKEFQKVLDDLSIIPYIHPIIQFDNYS